MKRYFSYRLVPIEELKPGDLVLAFTADGSAATAFLRNIITHHVNEYRVVRTAQTELQVTAEHPLYVGAGMFRTVEVLRPGDTILAYDSKGWREERILVIDMVNRSATVYDLQVDAPHTFFANGIAAHNKGGGGGCFPAGTQVLTPSGSVPIEALVAGDRVVAIDGKGRAVTARIEEAFSTTSSLLRVDTRHGLLYTTGEHPLLLADGTFLEAGDILSGDRVMVWRKGLLKRATALGTEVLEGEEVVYNLTVDGPHTFVADGFVVHNKGGGGGGYHGGGYHGGYSSGGGRPLSPEEGRLVAFIVLGIVGAVFVVIVRKAKSENLDQLYSRGDIEKKSAKTLKLLEFLSRQDPSVDPDVLQKETREIFVLLQKSWQEREYGPLKPLLMPDLYADHLRQIEGMRRNHEINIIDGLHVDAVDLVNVRYPLNRHEREYTALITATAQDYYIDDRTREKRRGDDSPAQFQEFWTFQFHDDAWLLREIEQAAESDILADENYFEQFTDKAVGQVYGETAGPEGPAGPWAEGEALAKEQRIERLLDHLVRTDKLWAKNRLLQTARSVFVAVTRSWESGTIEADVRGRLFPELAEDLGSAIDKNNTAGIGMEFRNLAVRKAELVLVKNFANNRNDEFVVRIRAHAQKLLKEHGTIVSQDADVTAFEEYLTFGRLDGDWKLKEIVAPAEGKALVTAENVDEGSSPRMIEWFYQHKRPV